MQDRLRRLVAFGILALVATLVAAASLRLDAASQWPVSAMMALVFGGPAAVLLLQRPLDADARPWVGWVARTLAPLSLGLVLVELILIASNPHANDALRYARLTIHASGVAVALWRHRSALGPRILALVIFLAVIPWTRTPVALAAFGAQAAAVVAVTGLRRDARAWMRAALVGSGGIVLGMALLVLTRGSLWPPRAALDSAGFSMLVVPWAVLVALAAVVTLALGRDRAPLAANS